MEERRSNIVKAKKVQQKVHDKPTSDVSYEAGQVVRVLNPSWLKNKKKKLSLKWHGPYIITEKVGPVTYRLKPIKGGVLPDSVHISRLTLTKEVEKNKEQVMTERRK